MQPAHGYMATRAGPQHADIINKALSRSSLQGVQRSEDSDGEETVSAQVSLKSTLHNVSCDGRNRRLGARP